MQASIYRGIKKLGQALLLFVLFHLLWLIFYYLSASILLEQDISTYLKQSLINTVSFVAFYAGAFWLFPEFVSKQKFVWLSVIIIAMAISLGKLQFKLQDWHPNARQVQAISIQPANSTKKMFPAVALRQSIGSDVRAMFNIIIFVIFGIGYAYAKDWFVKDRRARELEKEKIQGELTLLRYQLNPHFLFNTINDIYYLAIIKSDKTPDALLQLSNLLRYVLNEKEEWVPLDKELDHLQQFILLHKFRFPDEVIVQDTEFDDGVNSLYVAPLLLITFIENAFKHGEPGTAENPVTIRFNLQKGKLLYEVSNHINPSLSKDASSGIGIPNLERRLSLLYPNAHQLSFNKKDNRYIARLEMDLRYDTSNSY